MNNFSEILRQRLLKYGPLRLDHFLAEVISYYYAHHQPLGSEGDFVTAPEVSPLFGEMLGLWAVHTWEQMNKPSLVNFVELGPGRGTLMGSALGVIKKVAPEFYQALQVHLIEASPLLCEEQKNTLKVYTTITWHKNLDTLPEGPIVFIANEFFDALPVRQFMRLKQGWGEAYIIYDEEAKEFKNIIDPRPSIGEFLIPQSFRSAPMGSLVEISPASWGVMQELVQKLRKNGGAGVIIDYGHIEPRLGSTLQAVKRHQKVSIFDDLGNQDLTAHVDFSAMKTIAIEGGLKVYGPTFQGNFLRTLGIETRAQQVSKLDSNLMPWITSALHRLLDPEEMGQKFLVLGISHSSIISLDGFGTENK